MEPTDQELVADYLAGDEKAFERLLRRHLKNVYNFVYQMTRNLAEANDLSQDTFVKVWTNLRKFDQNKNFKTWLLTIAKNTVIDHWRRKKEFLLPTDQEVVDSTPLPDELFDFKENKQKLNEVLNHLPDEYREIVTQHDLEELTFAEISRASGRPLNTVKSVYRRALHQIRRLLRIY